MQKRLSLDFECCACGKTVGVTLECEGVHEDSFERPGMLKVSVPCPTCGQISEVYFGLTGEVHCVRDVERRELPVPSLN